MNFTRTIISTLIGIGLVVAAHLILDIRENSAPQALRRNTLVPTAEHARFITITHPGKPPAQLVRDDAWKITAPFSATANPAPILHLTDILAYEPIAYEMTDAELLRIGRTRHDFGLDSPRLTVTVAETEANAHTILFGAFTPAGDGIYAALVGKDSVFVVSSNTYATANITASDCRQRRLFALGADEITAFDIHSGSGTFVRILRNGETWKLTDPHTGLASTARVNDYLNKLLNLTAQDFVWPAGTSNETEIASASLLAGYGLDSESALTVTLKGTSDSDHTVLFGRDAGKDLVYALTQNATAIVTVPASARDAAVGGVNAFVDPRLFPLGDPAAISTLSLDDGDCAYLLSRNTDGIWHIDAPVSAPADSKVVESLLEKALALKTSDIVTNGVRIALGTNAEPTMVSRERILANINLEDCRSKEILRLDPQLIKRLVVTDVGQKPISVIRNVDKETWMLENAAQSLAPDIAAVKRLAAALNPLTALRIVKLKVSISDLGAYGLGKPARTIAIDQTSDKSVRRNIQIGDRADGGRFATLGSTDAVFIIPTQLADALMSPIAK